jgi:hypothetical protein
MGKTKLRTSRSTNILRSIVNCLLALLPFFLIYVFMDVLIHPRLHPRVYAVMHEIQHRHPRLAKALVYTPLAVGFGGQIVLVWAAGRAQRRLRSRGLVNKAPLKVVQSLAQTVIVKSSLLPNVGWTLISEVAPGLCVEAPDVRRTHWELISVDERRREMVLELRYTVNPLGAKVWTLYPRRLTCRLHLKGKGVRSELELRFQADSPMDYANVQALIDDSCRQLKQAVSEETAPRVVA